jgi:hypothetical protein
LAQKKNSIIQYKHSTLKPHQKRKMISKKKASSEEEKDLTKKEG